MSFFASERQEAAEVWQSFSLVGGDITRADFEIQLPSSSSGR
jgi:hypothetical protein